MPDLLNQGAYGRLTPPNDAGALAEAISAALRDDADDQHAIQEAIIAQYDISRLVADLSTLYRDLLAAKGKGPAHER